MKNLVLGAAAAIALAYATPAQAFAQADKNVLFILDSSGSMAQSLGGETKMAAAKRVFGESLKIPYGSTDLDKEDNGRDLRLALIAETKQETYPWVFVDGTRVPGGGDGTLQAYLDGKFDHLKSK